MKSDPKIVVVLPAYNAAKTLKQTYADVPKDKVDKIILVDDVIQDQTVEIARSGCPSSFTFKTGGMAGIRRPAILMGRFVLQRLGFGRFAIFNRSLKEVVSKYYHEAIFR